ncbi:MAG: serine--tRNA ligase [Acidimicrobiia bacterium]|nr:serine--tRNA ligase [Acidimicrobiia bacterium]
MIDVGILRERPHDLAAALSRRGVELDVAALAQIDAERRTARADAEEMRSQQKDVGKSIAGLSGDEKAAAIAEAGELSERYKAKVAEADDLDARFMEQWVTVPNLADETAADGFEEEDSVEVARWGQPPVFDFEAKDHVDLGVALGLIDIERATKISGSRFGMIKGKLALLEMAMTRWSMDVLTDYGFTPVVPPVLVRDQALFGTGFFPADREQVYSVKEDDLYLVGTSEVPLAAMHGDEILSDGDLPLRYTGFSTCFRVEAGTYGKDTRGIFRVHQFNKVEMFSFVEPDDSPAEHEFLLAREEELVQALEIPYRVVNVAAGDLGASAAKKYDIEAWFPGQERYREITSTSNTTDYQSRRLKVRFKDADGKNRLVHTLNGTAVTGRALIALVENHQQADGSVRIPEALRPYTGFDVIA